MLNYLYERTMRLAGHRHATWALAAVSFVESSVFPIPPDVLLIPMVLAAPRRAWALAAICTAASVAGGFLGYAIGYYAFAAIGLPVLEFYHALDKYEALKASFAEWGLWIIIFKGMTPIPYKIVTIASGALQFDIWKFALASAISRAMRFFLVAGLLQRFGEPMRRFIEARLMLVTSLFAIALVGGFLALRYL
ncbi:MAG TPA: YqaA family protein [Alphaproteobacteria bacterium]|nr:YqaA family protein [Alphaproteobacteria bacterium]